MSNYVGNVPVQPVGVRNGSALPPSGFVGELFYNTSVQNLFVFNGSTWSEAVTSGGDVETVSTLPSPVQVGQLVFLDTEEKVYVGTTAGWEPLQGTNFGAGLPVSGNIGDLFLDTNTFLLHIWTGSNWTQVGGSSVVNSGSVTPGSGSSEGELFFNTASDELLVWNGSSWIPVTDVSDSSLIQTGATLPVSGVSGELFFETSSNSLFVWSSGNWVSLMPGETVTVSSLPVSGEVGQIIFNTDDSNIYVWDGSDWIIVGGAATAGSGVVVGNTLPGSGNAGDLFFQTSDATLYVWDGSDWISLQETGGTGVEVGSSLPISGDIGDLFFLTTNNQLYVRTSTTWVSLQETVTTSGTTFPSSPSVGQSFFNTTEGVLYVWNGSQWVPQGGGSVDEIGVNSGVSVGQTATTSFSPIFSAPSTAGRRYILTSLHATNINSNEAKASARIDYTSTTNTLVINDIPIPEGGSIELLKSPKIIQPSDIVNIRADQNGTVSFIATYNNVSDTSSFGLGAIIANTSINTIYTAPARSRIDSIMLVNVGGQDTKVTVSWTNSANATQAFFSFEMLVPANSSVELIHKSKILPNGHRIRVEAEYANNIHVHVAGKR